MKSILHFSKFRKVVLLLLFAELMSMSAYANPGDTTWVTVFNTRKLTHYGDYDTTANFPTGKRYRKIRMHYILGRYNCGLSAQYCGSWDYTTKLYVSDSIEIARVITPYATNWLSQNKKHEYIMDVTDYASVLEGLKDFRFEYQGYSWGFTLTLKLEFIEGVPPMDALNVTNVYSGYFPYGAAPSATNDIENYLTAKTFTSYIAPVQHVYLRNTVSGHGSDATGCAEFCSKYYNLKVNGNQVSQKQLWKPNCGWNQEYAQTGTWIYDRANWCPGEPVFPIFHDLTSFINTNATYSLDIDMQSYTINNPSAGWNWTSQLIHYSAVNHALDASIEDIISPTTADDYRRENPNCQNPIIKLKNTGATPITEAVINYGVRGQTPNTYTWISSGLTFLNDTLVVLPSITSALSSSLNTNYFDVSLVSVNGVQDDNSYNNIYAAKMPSVMVLPENFITKFNNPDGGTSWNLYDENDNSLYNSGDGNEQSIWLNYGCYKFVLEDTQCNGLSFMNSSYGTFRLYDGDDVMNIYTFPTDFGCGFTKYFYVADPDAGVGIAKNNLNPNAVQIFPNPAENSVRVKFNVNTNQNVSYKLTDISGRLIQQKELVSNSETIDLTKVESGVYMLSVKIDGNTITKKLVVQK